MADRVAMRRVRASIEPAGSYAVDRTGVIGNFFDLRFTKAMLKKGRAALADESVVQRLHQRRLTQFGFKSLSLEFAAYLCSTGTALDASGVVTQDSISKVIGAMVGGYKAAAGSAVASGGTTTAFTVTGGHGGDANRFGLGQLFGLESAVGSGRIGAIGKVKTIATDAITSNIAFGFTPANTTKVYNCQLLYPADVTVAAATFIQFLMEQEDRDLVWLAMGCQGPITIEWPLGGFPTWGATFTGAKWLHDDDIGTPQGGAALAVATLDGTAPTPVTTGDIVLTAMSGSTRTTPTISKLTLNTGVAWGPAPSYNGIEGVAQMVMTRAEQPTVTMQVLADDESWTDALEAQTKYQMLARAGNVPGSTVALETGTMQLIAEPEQVEENGLDWWNLTFGLLEDENATDQTTDQRRAPWRVGRF